MIHSLSNGAKGKAAGSDPEAIMICFAWMISDFLHFLSIAHVLKEMMPSHLTR